MNLDQYNKKLLASLGTLVFIGILIFIIGVVYTFISNEFRYKKRNDLQNGIVVDKNQIIDTTMYAFNQEISILKPFQIDSLQPVFIVPIGQKDQTVKRIEVKEAGLGFSDVSLEEDYYYSSFEGLFNNFVLIDYDRDIRVPIFKTKIALTEWAYMKVNKKQLVLFKGTNKDINKDGMLNDDDFQSLFVYDINTLALKEFSFDNQTVEDFEPLRLTSKIYVRTGRDINNDKIFNYSKEPTDLYFYDVETGESETLIPENLKKEIQKTLNK